MIYPSNFVRRQVRDSGFSYSDHSWEEIARMTEQCFANQTPGYRAGVVLVRLDRTDGFHSSTCLLREGDRLVGQYIPRREGEMPRKQMGVIGGTPCPAKRVDVVLYHRDVLAEGNENTPLPDGSLAEWEIVSLNCSPTDDVEPMPVGTLLANHFHEAGSNDGGTNTLMSDAEFVKALHTSYLYWRDKAKAHNG